MHGFGVYYFHNGSRYEGEWELDMSHGKGTFFYNDGELIAVVGRLLVWNGAISSCVLALMNAVCVCRSVV